MERRGSVRMAVIGLGQMGSVHARVIRETPLSDLIAVADPHADRLRTVSEDLQVAAYRDYRTLLARQEIDAVSICTPDDQHLEPCLAAAEAGKHILLEKPLAADLAEANEIVRVCHERQVKLMVGHLLRFDPRYTAVQEAITLGQLGEVTHITAHRNSPWTEGPARYPKDTSLTMHVAVHDLDLVNWYLGATPVTVFAKSVRRKLADRGMDDAVSAILAFENGAIANLQYSWALPPTSVTTLDARLELIGTEGMAFVGSYHGQGVFIASSQTYRAPDVHHRPTIHHRLGGDVREELLAFCESILENQPPPVTGEASLLAVREATAIETSIRSGEVVTFADLA